MQSHWNTHTHNLKQQIKRYRQQRCSIFFPHENCKFIYEFRFGRRKFHNFVTDELCRETKTKQRKKGINTHIHRSVRSHTNVGTLLIVAKTAGFSMNLINFHFGQKWQQQRTKKKKVQVNAPKLSVGKIPNFTHDNCERVSVVCIMAHERASNCARARARANTQPTIAREKKASHIFGYSNIRFDQFR